MITEEALNKFSIVVTDAGSTWIGRIVAYAPGVPTHSLHDGSIRGDGRTFGRVLLEDAYVFRVSQVQGPGGQIGMQRSIWPLEALCGHPSLVMDAACVTAAACRSLADLDAAERAEIARWIDGAEQIRTQGRAAKAGIVIAGGIPRPS